jgi:hypothetical protein
VEPLGGPMRLAGRRRPDEHHEAGIRQAHPGRPTTPRRATPVAWTESLRCAR